MNQDLGPSKAGNARIELFIVLSVTGALALILPYFEEFAPDTKILDGTLLRTISLFVAMGLWLLYFKKGKLLRSRVFPRLGHGLGRFVLDPCVFIILYRLLMFLPPFLNKAMDFSTPELRQVLLSEVPRFQFHVGGGGPRCYLSTSTWRAKREAEEFEADPQTCSKLAVGDMVFLNIRSGALGFEWVESYSANVTTDVGRSSKTKRKPIADPVDNVSSSDSEEDVADPFALISPGETTRKPTSKSVTHPADESGDGPEEEPDESIPVPSFGK